MGVAEIEAVINAMTTPNTIITGFDVTGIFWDVTLYGLFAVIVLATGYHYKRLSSRIAIASFINLTLSALLYSQLLVSQTAFFRFIVVGALSVVYLYADKSGYIPSL
jgi:hypothetical protein